MKKKLLLLIISALFAVCLPLGLTGCNDKGQTGGENSNLGDSGGMSGEHVHDWGEWVVTSPAQCTEDGEETRVCKTDSSHKETRKLLKLGHSVKADETKCENCGQKLAGSFEFKFKGSSLSLMNATPTRIGKIIIPKLYCGLAVTSIENNAFEHENITEISFPENINFIDANAFEGCDGLKKIDVEADNAEYSSLAGILYDKAQTKIIFVPKAITGKVSVADGVTEIGDSAFSERTGLTGVTFGENSQLGKIGDYAFAGCTNLITVDIPQNVKQIGNYAFDSCARLTVAPLPDNLVALGESAFADTNLGSVTIPQNLNYIPKDAFKGSKLVNLELPESIIEIKENAFAGCEKLETLNIPDSLTSIGLSAFEYCKKLKSITAGENSNLKDIESKAFYNCKELTTVTIPKSVERISLYAFDGCTKLEKVCITDLEAWFKINLMSNPLENAHDLYLNGEIVETLNIPFNITSIGLNAFKGCSIKELTYDANSQLGEIGDYAFAGCNNLKNVTLPQSVKTLSDFAFSGCTALESIYFGEDSQLTSIGKNIFADCTRIESITIPNGVTSIPYMAFGNCTKLETVSFGENSRLTAIGQYAFKGCTNFRNITIPKLVNDIEKDAFYCDNPNDYKLESITVDEANTVYASQDGILYNKDKTQFILIPKAVKGAVTIPDTIQGIPDETFYQRSNITDLTIGKDGTEIIGKEIYHIGNLAFANCTSLKSVTLNLNNVVFIGEEAFRGCSSLESVTLNNVVSIDEEAFGDCTSLESVTIPNSVIVICEEAFRGCTNLKNAIFEHKDGWYCDIPSDPTSGTYLTSGNLNISATAAEYLTDTYCSYYWQRTS